MIKSFDDAAYRVLQHTPFGLNRRLAGKRLLLPAYHAVSDEHLPHLRNLYPYRTVRQFKADLEFLLKHYRPVELSQVLECLRTHAPFPKDTFLLTFDDGLREIYEVVAPVLRQFGVAATFFLVADFLDNRALGHDCRKSLILEAAHADERVSAQVVTLLQESGVAGTDVDAGVMAVRYDQRELLDRIGTALGIDFADYLKQYQPFMTSEQVEQLIGQGFSIGAHSLDHPMFSQIALAEQLRQTRESVAFVTGKFSLGYKVFAFPYHSLGVSKGYFRQVFDEGTVEACFGTAGFLEDCDPRMVQRLRMEYKNVPAAERVFEVCVEHTVARLGNRHIVPRAD